MQKSLVLILLLFIFNSLSAQEYKQVIRGRVVDKDSKFPLPGATVVLASDTINLRGVTTGPDGFFRLEQVPVGRQAIKISYIGYGFTAK